jgi:arginine/ornithine N-succinyltransferase beta subunit
VPEKSLFEIAEERVCRRFPAPKYDPMTAGIGGLAITAASVGVFVTLAGLDTDAFGGASAITAIAGFLLPYLYYRHEHSQHSMKVAKEYERLIREQDAKGS